MRLRLFLDRWQQGRFVDYAQREQSNAHYHPRFGTEFGIDVLLTAQGAPSLMQWRGAPLMKNVFDFAMYPALIAELRPRSIFEIGSGLGASALWFADTMAFSGTAGHVHSVDKVKASLEHPPSRSIRATAQRRIDCSIANYSAPHRIHGWSSRTRTTMWRRCSSNFILSAARRLSGRRRQRRGTRCAADILPPPSRRLCGRYTLYRLLRPQRDLCGRLIFIRTASGE